jgi:hypothetical protein
MLSLQDECYNYDVAYGIGAIKRNVKNVAGPPPPLPDITSKTLKLYAKYTRLDILLRNRK